MKNVAFAGLCLMALLACGCGSSGDQGPANAADTPAVSEKDVKDKMTQGMPDNAKKMYESYQKGSTPRR